MDEVEPEVRVWERFVRDHRERPLVITRAAHRSSHPQVVNYKRARYGRPRVRQRVTTRPRSLRPPE